MRALRFLVFFDIGVQPYSSEPSSPQTGVAESANGTFQA